MNAVLVYDGDCGLCTRTQRWLLARTPPARVTARAAQSCTEEELAAFGLHRELLEHAVGWVGSDGAVCYGAPALAAALRATRGWTRALGAALTRPPLAWCAPTVYRLVARYRHLLTPGPARCGLPPR